MRNFEFFGAPVGLIVTLNRELEQGSWIDAGIFLGVLTTAITSVNLGCCIQASFSVYGETVREVLNLGQDGLVVCGVAVGHTKTGDRVNHLPHRRLAMDEVVRFHK